jgi:hypothetical protein
MNILQCYRPLPPEPGSIRLLRLLPSVVDDGPLQGQLVDYSLISSGNQGHKYNALPYVWGSVEDLKFMKMGIFNLSITANL